MQPERKATTNYGRFPEVRLRRNRHHEWLRRLVAETRLSVADLIQPVFVRSADSPAEIPSMPGIHRYTITELVDYVRELSPLKIPAVILFPYYEKSQRSKNVVDMLTPDNLQCLAARTLKQEFPDIGVIVDLALDVYTQHGQDGIIKDGRILNDSTLEIISRYAVVQAESGADIIAPSEMMDGRVGVIRQALDARGFQDVGIMSYAAKYASNFYGPFRNAVGSKDCLAQADKQTYQIDPANSLEAIREVALDIEEGADSVIVKPGLLYLDVLAKVKQTFGMPTFAYHVSGEYSMLKAAEASGWLDFDLCLIESLLAFKRAGADGILTYGALDAAKLLQETS